MNNLPQKALTHLGVIALFLIICTMYFKPVIDGKVLHEGDNVQARGMQTEIRNARAADKEKEYFLWTNQSFLGMPTYMLHTMSKPSLFENINEYATLNNLRRSPIGIVFRLMLFAYLALLLFNMNWLPAAVIALSFGLLSNNIIYIDAGHTTKILALIYVPPLIASAWVAMRKKWIFGSLLFFVLLALQFKAAHIQITYYTFLAIAILGAGELIRAFKKQLLPQFFKGVIALSLAVGIGALSNLHALWANSEYSQETTRGKSELTQKENKKGLDKEYIFGWSMGKMETMTLLIPNFMGGSSSESWLSDQESATWQAFGQVARQVKDQQQLGQLQRYTTKYWGAQPFTSGPSYYGAIVIFLFILGIFTVRGPLKWGILISTILFIMLSWGDNFAAFNYAMVDYFPLYNKFRAVTMTLMIAQSLIILLGGLGVHYLFKYKENPNLQHPNSLTAKLLGGLKREMNPANMVLLAGAVTSLFCIFGLMYSFMGDLSCERDAALAQFPVLLTAIEEDRAGLIQADAFKSLVFVLLATGVLWAAVSNKIATMIGIILVGVLSAADLLVVDRHYVNEESFVEPTQVAAPQASQADLQVLQDKDPHYRVLDLSRGNPIAGAQTCYFHKSFGGYFAAKPMLYQEVIERYYNNEILGANKHILDMCNVKYIIQSPEFAVQNPTYLGNCWFVNSVDVVENADAEIAGLAGLNPSKKAITQQKNATYLEGLVSIPDSVIPKDLIRLESYHPEKMVYKSYTNSERFAVFSEIYYPTEKGWNVYIDGEKQEQGFIKVNYLLRGLRVPSGEHTIEMRFEPRSFILGRTISKGVAILVFLSLLALAFLFYKQVTNPDEPKPTQPKFDRKTKEEAVKNKMMKETEEEVEDPKPAPKKNKAPKRKKRKK